MEAIKRLSGIYMIGVAIAVAVYFIINPFLVDSFEVINVWRVLNVLMAIGLLLALIFNYARKQKEDAQDPNQPATRRHLDVNVSFYLTAAVTILFLHNWFSLLALGESSLNDTNQQAWVIWAFVDTVLPLVLGVTGCRLWCKASSA